MDIKVFLEMVMWKLVDRNEGLWLCEWYWTSTKMSWAQPNKVLLGLRKLGQTKKVIQQLLKHTICIIINCTYHLDFLNIVINVS